MLLVMAPVEVQVQITNTCSMDFSVEGQKHTAVGCAQSQIRRHSRHKEQ